MYVICLKHTNKSDPFLTLWRPDNKGYCQSLQLAGLYFNPEKGYHDSDDNMPVPTEIIERMATTVMYDGELKSFVPNNRYILAELGLKFKGNNLIKLDPILNK